MKKLPRQIYPHLLEAEYARRMISLVDATRRSLQPLKDALPSLLAWRQDAPGDEGRRAKKLIDDSRDRMRVPTADLEAVARQFASRTSKINHAQLGAQVRAGLGVDLLVKDKKLRTATDRFVSHNVSLIQSIPDRVHDQVEALVLHSVTGGVMHGDLADAIDERFDVGESNARRIARDQIGKYYGQVNHMRQRELGVRRFRWRSVGDERVRSSHRELEEESEDEPFEYSDPPLNDDGDPILPGEEAECRCTAEPDLGSIDDDTDDDTDEDDD